MSYQKGPGQTVVIALGGNALGNTPQEQLELVKNTASHIVDMVGEGVNVVVSHGNGPQVGMIQNAFDYANAHDGKTPAMPLPECGAMSQGYIGYQLSQAILNELKRRDIMRSSVALITQTVVDANDPAFQDPTKPVGAFLTEDEAVRLANETGATFKEDAGRGWRQVVASPAPVRIVELPTRKSTGWLPFRDEPGTGRAVLAFSKLSSVRSVTWFTSSIGRKSLGFWAVEHNPHPIKRAESIQVFFMSVSISIGVAKIMFWTGFQLFR